MFLYLSILSILTSRIIVFFAISSSSDSLNFLMPTARVSNWFLTELASFLALGFVDYAVGTFSYNSDNVVFVH
jgi:hypothetical protein